MRDDLSHAYWLSNMGSTIGCNSIGSDPWMVVVPRVHYFDVSIHRCFFPLCLLGSFRWIVGGDEDVKDERRRRRRPSQLRLLQTLIMRRMPYCSHLFLPLLPPNTRKISVEMMRDIYFDREARGHMFVSPMEHSHHGEKTDSCTHKGRKGGVQTPSPLT